MRTFRMHHPDTGKVADTIKALTIAGSCPTAWCNCGGVVTALSGGAGLIRRPRRAG